VNEEGNKYEATILLGPRMYRRKMCYRVRWTGYGPEHDAWVPVPDIDGSLVAEFEAKKARDAHRGA
jgi:hypothetical protein